MNIANLIAREILDSRGNPTVFVEACLDNGVTAGAAVPSGASTGVLEALELRDGDKGRYNGKGVLQAVENVQTEINAALRGCDPADQQKIDDLLIQLDGTKSKERLGANALLGVSLACARVAAKAQNIPLYQHLGQLFGNNEFLLPTPQMNIINGGAHADNLIDFQEFMIIPVGFDSFSESLRCGVEIFHCLRTVLLDKKLSTGVGDEGGFAPECQSNEEALKLIMQAIDKSGYHAGDQVFIGLDAASSEFYQDGKYHLKSEDRQLDAAEFCDYLERWVENYPIVSIEDPIAEDDWQGWSLITQRLADKIQITGDDLFVTNASILQKGIDTNVANSILIKVNQIGTLSETLETIRLAKSHNYSATISHRSGETEDTTIADLAVATAAGQIKTGSLCRSDRVAKYNRLLAIERQLGDSAKFAAGKSLFR